MARSMTEKPTGHQQARGGYKTLDSALVSEAFLEFGNLTGKLQVLLPVLLVIRKTDPLLQSLLEGNYALLFQWL